MQGVMLSHANLNYQLNNLDFFLSPRAGDRSLSLLPPWHIYERSCGYFLYSRACTQVELKSLACTQMRELQSDQESASSHPGLPCMRFSALWAYLFIATQMLFLLRRCTLTLGSSRRTCPCTLRTTLYVSP